MSLNRESSALPPTVTARTLADKITYLFEHHWLAVFNSSWGLFVTLPFIAPLCMTLGLTIPGRILYFIYNFFCHQLPERSWFLFGPQFSYTKVEIATAWGRPLEAISNEIVRRQFIGTPEIGWKVAWSDRMVAMYGSIFIFGLIYALLRQAGFKMQPIHWAWFLLALVPMGLDGTSHLINDLFRLTFRDTNDWAAMLTMHMFSDNFYHGDMFGSLNSVLRLFTGVIFGLGVVGFLWPIMDEEFSPQIGARNPMS